MKYLVGATVIIPTRQHTFLKYSRQAAKPNNVIKNVILKRVLLVIMIKLFKDVDDTIGYFTFLTVKMPIVILKVRSEELMLTIFIKRPARLFLKCQVVILQTAQTWANVGVCGGLCACAVGGTFD